MFFSRCMSTGYTGCFVCYALCWPAEAAEAPAQKDFLSCAPPVRPFHPSCRASHHDRQNGQVTGRPDSRAALQRQQKGRSWCKGSSREAPEQQGGPKCFQEQEGCKARQQEGWQEAGCSRPTPQGPRILHGERDPRSNSSTAVLSLQPAAPSSLPQPCLPLLLLLLQHDDRAGGGFGGREQQGADSQQCCFTLLNTCFNLHGFLCVTVKPLHC